MPLIRILIADEQRVFRHELRQICEIKGEFEVIGEAADGEETVYLTDLLKPDVILMDVNIPKLNGTQLISEVLRLDPQARILILSMDPQNQSVINAVEAGAKGYLLKTANAREVVETVHRVYQDELAVTPQTSVLATSVSRRQGINILGELRTFLDSLLDIASEAIICLNEAQEIILFSTGAEAIFGYTHEEIIGQPINSLIPEGVHQSHNLNILRFIASSMVTRQMNQPQGIFGKRRNGEIFPAEASIAKHKTEDGLILAVILRDISKQRQLEERLRKLSVVVEQTPASVLITDTSGKIEYVNPAFEHVTGYAADEVIGQNPSILKSGLMPGELYQSMWKTITEGEIWKGEICNRKKDGELFWELGTVSPILNSAGVITNFISVKEDITERKKIEEELTRYRQQLEELVEMRTAALLAEIDEHRRTEMMLREKEQSLDLALRIGQLGSWEYDFGTREITWADEVYRIFGLNPAENKINYQLILEMVHPDDLEMVQNALNDSISNHQPLNIDHKIISGDGQERVINLTAVPISDNRGNATKMVGTVQEITDRVRIRAELLEKERMSKELAIGRSIQLSMIPKDSPSVDGWQFAGFYQAAREIGGDFYDWIKLPNGEIGMLIADASDKGVPAALFMALSRAIVRTNALSSDGPVATIVRSNEILFRDYFNGQFVSIIFASLDSVSGHIQIVNAGHNYPLFYSLRNQEVQAIQTNGTVIGLFPHVPLDPVTIDIMPGDVLVFYTDGLIEATNLSEDFFEEQRVIEIIKANAHRHANEILGAIVQSWQNFVGELPQADDLTLIVAKRANPEEGG